MTKLDIPKIEPINVKQYEFKQSPYKQADKLPFRSIIVSASQGGKGIIRFTEVALKEYTLYHQLPTLMKHTKK